MKLFFRESGSGPPIIILHGLFGMSDNWMTMAKRFSENGFHALAPDLRNHGQSPHSDDWNFKTMSEDVFELMSDKRLNRPVLIGHSMGGKVAMEMAAADAEKFSGIVVSDIAPRKYPVVHGSIVSALNSLKIETLSSRKEVEEILSKKINDAATLQFLLKSVYWKETPAGKVLSWRFNLEVISKKIEASGEKIDFSKTINMPALMVRGEFSDYVSDEDIAAFKKVFSLAQAVTIKNSGHWIHADRPEEFFETVIAFLKRVIAL